MPQLPSSAEFSNFEGLLIIPKLQVIPASLSLKVAELPRRQIYKSMSKYLNLSEFTLLCISTKSSTMINIDFNPFERIDKNNVALLIVDHQIGLFQIVRDYSPEEFRANILAHAAIGNAFNLPTVMTTSAEHGKHIFDQTFDIPQSPEKPRRS